LDVWLQYRRVAETPARPGPWECGPGRNPRWLDEARVCVTAARPDPVDPWQPPGVPGTVLAAGAAAAAAEDPERTWPVYLGRIASTHGGAPFAVEPSLLPFAGLTAEQVVSPSTTGRAVWDRLQVGAEAVGDARRFAVRLRDAHGALVDRCTIDRRGAAAVTGDVRLAGDLVVARPAGLAGRDPDPEQAAGGLHLLPSAAPPAEAAPWRVYRTVATEDGQPVDQLRVEVGNPGDKGDPSTYRLAIGHVRPTGRFVPCLTVTAACEVTVHGDLNVERLVKAPIQADPNDPAFAIAMANAWTQGLSAPGALADNLRSDALSVTLAVPGTVVHGQPPAYTATVRNTGQAPLSFVAVFEDLMIGNDVARRGWIAAGITLVPGATRTVTPPSDPLSPPGSAGQQLSIGVLAVGIRPVNDLVATTTKQTVTLQ
jgi:hypothetical protein